MLLLTGATGLVGGAVLRRLTAGGEPVRCLVRDPRRLGAERAGAEQFAWLTPVGATLHHPARASEALAGPAAVATWDEAQLLAVPQLSGSGTEDAGRPGVEPRRMADVLGSR